MKKDDASLYALLSAETTESKRARLQQHRKKQNPIAPCRRRCLSPHHRRPPPRRPCPAAAAPLPLPRRAHPDRRGSFLRASPLEGEEERSEVGEKTNRKKRMPSSRFGKENPGKKGSGKREKVTWLSLQNFRSRLASERKNNHPNSAPSSQRSCLFPPSQHQSASHGTSSDSIVSHPYRNVHPVLRRGGAGGPRLRRGKCEDSAADPHNVDLDRGLPRPRLFERRDRHRRGHLPGRGGDRSRRRRRRSSRRAAELIGEASGRRAQGGQGEEGQDLDLDVAVDCDPRPAQLPRRRPRLRHERLLPRGLPRLLLALLHLPRRRAARVAVFHLQIHKAAPLPARPVLPGQRSVGCSLDFLPALAVPEEVPVRAVVGPAHGVDRR